MLPEQELVVGISTYSLTLKDDDDIGYLCFSRERPPYDTNRLDKFLHQLKGSSASVGANKAWIETNEMREAFKSEHVERTKSQFQLVKRAHETLKVKMETYFHLLREAGPADAAHPPK
ncbi:pseudo histidine-containing phosphotransfer protein 1-like [Malus domestica]|uniref:pseudo histidine-containing phosphotransfer protein 1-like n=1 Tax=Malus domestica TaxID=3750 RepID=UPI0039754797